MSVTFGSSTAPSQVTVNLDSLFGLSLAAYRKELIDNIGATNAFFHEMITKELYESQEGGTYIQVPVMYALTPADSYDGYDELSTLPTDGITDCIQQWRQYAAPIAYSMKEVKQNKQKIIDLVTSRIKQAELGLQEAFAQSFMWGAAGNGGTGAITSQYVSPVNGSLGMDPIGLLVAFAPTNSVSICNINQSSNTWWQNKTYTSATTTYDGLFLEVDHTFNTAALGTGGKPKLIFMDQTTYELFIHAVYQHFRFESVLKTDQTYPFENIVYKGAHFVMDEKTPDAYSGTIGMNPSGATSMIYGSAYYLNTDFFKLIYETDSDFELLKDENGKTFQKPVNGDSRVANVAWMGNTIVTNRRKQAVHGKIARTLTTP
jgi:hypothetical protein